MPRFTPTEKKLLTVLADGKPHRRDDLFALLGNALNGINSVRAHITNIRNKLPEGIILVSQEDTLHTYIRESTRRPVTYRLMSVTATGLAPEHAAELGKCLNNGHREQTQVPEPPPAV